MCFSPQKILIMFHFLSISSSFSYLAEGSRIQWYEAGNQEVDWLALYCMMAARHHYCGVLH